MAQSTATEAAVESVPRPIDSRPESEVAQEIQNMPPGEADMHDDPDAPNPPPSAAESAEAVGEWRAAKSLLKLRNQVNALAPGRSKASDGTIGDQSHCGGASSTSDHCARIRDGGVGVVAAMDITHDPAGGCDAGAIAASIHAGRDGRVKYIIWNRRIANSSAIGSSQPWAWRPYSGANPHNRHVHISVKPTKPEYDSEAAWSVSVTSTSPTV